MRKELAGHPGSYKEPDLKAVPDEAMLDGGSGAPAGGEPPKPATPPAEPSKG